MKLTRPLAFVDLESTGTSVAKDRIVSIAVITYYPEEHQKTPQTSYTLVNPEMPIPAEASAVHGITDAMVAEAPTFLQISASLFDILSGADIAGYNSNKFDIPLLIEEFLRVGIELDLSDRHLVDVFTIFSKHEPRDLSAALKFFCGLEMEDAHNALADTRATAKILGAQLLRYQDMIGMNVPEIAQYCKPEKPDGIDYAGTLNYDADGDVIYTIGKGKGKKLKDDPGFGQWMLKQDFYTLETKKRLKAAFAEIDAQKVQNAEPKRDMI